MKRLLLFALSVALLIGALFLLDLRALADAFAKHDFLVVFSLLVIGFLNLAVVSARLKLMLSHINKKISFFTALHASVVGLIASFYVFQIAGSIVGRYYVLAENKVGPSEISMVTLYERVFLFAVGFTIFGLSSVFLFGYDLVVSATLKIPLLEIGIAASVLILLCFQVLATRSERQQIRALASRKVFSNAVEVIVLCLASQIVNLTAFVIALSSFSEGLDPVSLFAAAGIVAFMASLPISFNGWGIREVAAIYVFGHLGLAAEEAVSVSILVGLCSTAVVVLGFLFGKTRSVLQLRKGAPVIEATQNQVSTLSTSLVSHRALASVLAGVATVLLFFQVHVPIGTGALSVNLADPFSLVSVAVLGVFVALCWQDAQFWTSRYFFWALSACGIALLLAFAHGYFTFGLVQWALTNRIVGFVFVLGYVALGALVMLIAGRQGLRRMMLTFVVCAVCITGVSVVKAYLFQAGLLNRLLFNFEGYSYNRNTFGFLLILACAVMLSYDTVFRRLARQHLWTVLLSIIVLGIILTEGRAVAGAALAVCCGAVLLDPRCFRRLALAIAGALVMYFAISTGMDLAHVHLEVSGNHLVTVERKLNLEQPGDWQRWLSMQAAWEMFTQYPIFGSGLGGFVRQNLGLEGASLVIHSTPLWLLAELGFLGTAIFVTFFLVVAMPVLRRLRQRLSVPEKLLILTLIAFGVMGLVHDIMYQRAFWVFIGALAAVPATLTNATGVLAKGRE